MRVEFLLVKSCKMAQRQLHLIVQGLKRILLPRTVCKVLQSWRVESWHPSITMPLISNIDVIKTVLHRTRKTTRIEGVEVLMKRELRVRTPQSVVARVVERSITMKRELVSKLSGCCTASLSSEILVGLSLVEGNRIGGLWTRDVVLKTRWSIAHAVISWVASSATISRPGGIVFAALGNVVRHF